MSSRTSHAVTPSTQAPGPSEDSLTQPIAIREIANIFRKPINKNERPMEKAVMTRNNVLVERWQYEVLAKICDKTGCIPVGRVANCLRYFTEGFEILQCQKFKDHMPKYSPEDVEFWIKFISESDIEELHEAGITVISAGWSIITGALRNHFSEKRYEVVYSQSSDPAVWDSLANDNPHLMHGRPMPFGLTVESMSEMEQKVRVILGNVIQPK